MYPHTDTRVVLADDAPCPDSPDCGLLADDFDEETDAIGRLAAVRASPFVHMLGNSFYLRERVSSLAAFGGELGMFFVERLRLSARVLVPVAAVNDEITASADKDQASAWLWGFSVGAAANRQDGFAMSPSLQYLRPQGGDFGHNLGFIVPFEWLGRSGFRVGFDFSVLYGFGGHYRRPASQGGGTADRPNATGFAASLMIGQVFSMPGKEG